MADESPGTVLAPDALNPQSFLVIENGQAFQKTQAVIVLLKTVSGKWKLIAQFLNLLPGMVTDKLYDWVAAIAPSLRSSSIVSMSFASACSTALSAGGFLRPRNSSAHLRKKYWAASETCSSGSRRRATIGSGKNSVAARPIVTTSLRKRMLRIRGSGSNSRVK